MRAVGMADILDMLECGRLFGIGDIFGGMVGKMLTGLRGMCVMLIGCILGGMFGGILGCMLGGMLGRIPGRNGDGALYIGYAL